MSANEAGKGEMQPDMMSKTRDTIIPGMAWLDWVAILPVWKLT